MDIAFTDDRLRKFCNDSHIPATDLSTSAIEHFARQIKIAAGCVVGRLRHDGQLGFHQRNTLKRHLRWSPSTES